MPELQIGIADGAKLNFNQSFLKFNVKEKTTGEGIILDLTLNAEY